MAAEATACVVEVVQGLAEGARVQHPARQHPGVGVLEADSATHRSSTRVTLHKCEWPCAYGRAVAMVPQVENLAAGRARLEAVSALQHESWEARDVHWQCGASSRRMRTCGCGRRRAWVWHSSPAATAGCSPVRGPLRVSATLLPILLLAPRYHCCCIENP
ncbi:uncharacterized protein LOC123426193 isoform X1 [Hordeum vulgare subsp. vulgare]|uniref:uncharacterized protein LOC123426193 isoform X1 n=1 Tax=Hordeum vulgare subsp. vulgare TaxID=112509 RepID=UPI001D1A3EDB|nr:uncharacterized protein LOC123426193 isoform X1 [Hordeum vulgare subsp. vulgare]XP_044965917.1 uncharacterized protein LOC123426193 isoform X1 [Hordeum vulgare subsp. vulgare]